MVFRRDFEEACAYAFRLLQCHDAARDVVQQSFCKMSRLYLGKTEKELRRLLFSSIKHAVIDHVRRQANEAAGASGGLDDLAQMATNLSLPSAEGVIVNRETLATVRSALSKMPRKRAELFLRYRLDGQTMKSLAEQYGVSEATVSREIERAMVAIRKMLG